MILGLIEHILASSTTSHVSLNQIFPNENEKQKFLLDRGVDGGVLLHGKDTQQV